MTGHFRPASSIDLDCHIVHVCSSIYLDYHFFKIYAHALLFIKPDYSTCIYDLLVFISIHSHASMQGSDW